MPRTSTAPIRRMRALVALLGLLLALAAAGSWVPAALGCSCAPPTEPREDLDNADAAVYGTVAERVVRGGSAVFRIRVVESYKGEVGPEVRVRTSAHGASCGIEADAGDEIGLLLYRVDGGWTSTLCSQRTREQLEAGLRPGPQPDSSRPVRMVVGAQFGPERVAGLDARGRLVRTGSGRGEVEALSACPGGRTVVELVRAPSGHYSVAARAVEGFRVRTATGLRLDPRRTTPTDVRCLSRGGGRSAVAVSGGGGSRLLSLRSGTVRTAWVTGHRRILLGRRHAWAEGRRPVRVHLRTGRRTRLAPLHRPPVLLAASPSGRRLLAAVSEGRGERLLLLDGRTGRVLAARRGAYFEAAVFAGERRVAFAERGRLIFSRLGLAGRPAAAAGHLLAARGGHVVVVRNGRLHRFSADGRLAAPRRRLFTGAVRAIAVLPPARPASAARACAWRTIAPPAF